MELKDTMGQMISGDYRERFQAEYNQTKIRYEKLKDFTTSIEAGERTKNSDNPYTAPMHDCPYDVLREQQSIMGQYLHILEVRAKIEGIALWL